MGNIPIWCGDDKIPKNPYTVSSLCVLCWCIFIWFFNCERDCEIISCLKITHVTLCITQAFASSCWRYFIEVFHMEERSEIYEEKNPNVGDFTLTDNVMIPNWWRCGYGGTLNIRYFTSVHTGQISATYMYWISLERNDPFLRMVSCNWSVESQGYVSLGMKC